MPAAVQLSEFSLCRRISLFRFRLDCLKLRIIDALLGLRLLRWQRND